MSLFKVGSIFASLPSPKNSFTSLPLLKNSSIAYKKKKLIHKVSSSISSEGRCSNLVLRDQIDVSPACANYQLEVRRLKVFLSCDVIGPTFPAQSPLKALVDGRSGHPSGGWSLPCRLPLAGTVFSSLMSTGRVSLWNRPTCSRPATRWLRRRLRPTAATPVRPPRVAAACG